jgi:putative alpha-1,2-mannosidase
LEHLPIHWLIPITSGKELIIQTENNSKENVYIQSVSFNNEKIENYWIDRNKLMTGGTIQFEMGAMPKIVNFTATPPP